MLEPIGARRPAEGGSLWLALRPTTPCFVGGLVSSAVAMAPAMAHGGAMPSLDSGPTANAHKEQPSISAPTGAAQLCPKRFLLWEKCGHGNSRFVWVGCGSPRCEVCLEQYIQRELVLEIKCALRWCRVRHRTLKFVTLTFQRDNPAAMATPEGAELRRKHLARLIQKMRRQKIDVEYLRTIESHKSGRIHMHLLLTFRYFDQRKLSDWWRAETGDSGIVWITAVFMKCPSCWDRSLSAKEKAKAQIVGGTAKNRCRRCGYRPESIEDVAHQAALEIGKYLAKDFADSPGVKVLTRSRGWLEFKREAEEMLKAEKAEKADCFCCGVVHEHTVIIREDHRGVDLGRSWAWRFDPEELAVDGLASALWGVVDAGFGDGRGVGFVPPKGEPCLCWGDSIHWVACLGDRSGETPGVAPEKKGSVPRVAVNVSRLAPHILGRGEAQLAYVAEQARLMAERKRAK